MSRTTPHPSRRRGPLLLGLALLAVVVGCGRVDEEQSGRRITEPPATVMDHREVRQTGESVSIAAQLVPVPGYKYKNVSAAERAAAEARVRKEEKASGAARGEVFSSVSFHGVVADDESQNTAHSTQGAEVGFLQLNEFTDPPPAEVEQQFGSTYTGNPVVDSFQVGGTTVWVTTQAGAPDSKYMYVWSRDGVVAAFDGATRPETEKWVRTYLAVPVLSPGETGSLSAALHPTPGYVFGNFVDRTVRDEWVTGPFGDGVDYSLHQVADATHTVGGLLLVDAGGSSTSAERAQKVADSFDGATVGAPTTVAGTQVVPVSTGQMEAFVWVRDGVTGIYLSSNADTAPPFLAAFLGTPG